MPERFALRQRVRLFCDEGGFHRRLGIELRRQGLIPVFCGQPASGEGLTPGVLDILGVGSDDQGLAQIRAYFAAIHQGEPVILLTSGPSLALRRLAQTHGIARVVDTRHDTPFGVLAYINELLDVGWQEDALRGVIWATPALSGEALGRLRQDRPHLTLLPCDSAESFFELEHLSGQIPNLLILAAPWPESADTPKAVTRMRELLAFLRQDSRYQALPVVALGDGFDSQDRQYLISQGAHCLEGEINALEALSPVLFSRNWACHRMTGGLSQLHRQLREAEFQRQALDEHAIVSITDVAGRITYANQRFVDISQFELSELLGHTHRIVKSGVHGQVFYQQMWTTILGGQPWHGEVCNRRRDGSLYWVQATILPFLGEDGLPERYISIRTDITARKEQEIALRLAQRRQEVIAAALEEYIHAGDPARAAAILLQFLVEVCDSPLGFIGEVLRNEAGGEYVRTHAITPWREESPAGQGRVVLRSLEFPDVAALFGTPTARGNAYMTHQNPPLPPGGLPDTAHPPLADYLTLPVRQGGRLVGVIGLANRIGGYPDKLVEEISPVVSAYGFLLDAADMARAQRLAEAQLLHVLKEQAAIFDALPVGLCLLRNRVVERCNRQLGVIFGFSEAELIQGGPGFSMILKRVFSGMAT